MRAWLRRLLIVLTVGGGFLGLVLGVPALVYAARADSPRLVEALVFAPVYLYAIYLGIRLADGHKPLWGLLFYFGLQVPWIDCPSFSYRFYSGAMVSLNFTDAGQSWFAAVGYLQQLLISPQMPTNFGVNIIALLIVIALIIPDLRTLEVTDERSNQSMQPTAGRSDSNI